jgi:hypothetical protein
MVLGERRKGKDSYLWKEFKYSGVRAGIAELQASDQNIEMRVLQGKKQDLDLKRLTSEPEILNNPNVPKSFPLDQDFTVALINRKTSLVTLKTQMDFIFKSIPAAPQIIIAESGNSFEGEITDNLAVRKLEASFDSGKKFLDITDEVTFSNPMTRVGKFTWEPAASRILPSGNYSIRLRVADFSDNQSQSNDFAFKASPCDRFLHQSVYQDNPDLPFPNSSWSTGPFKVADNLPFFEIRTQGETPGMDIDLYLFEDKNHDGQVNGMEENILKSAGPLSNERIFMENPESSEYFIYVHGFDVPAQGGKFSLFSSEVINSSIAGNRGPTGYLNDSTHKTPLNIFCKYKGISSLDRDKTKFQLNGVDLTEDIIFSDSLISYDISDNLLQNTPYNIMLELGDFCGTDQILEWNFIIDRTPPHLKIIEPVASKKTVSEVICFNSKQMDIFEGQADVLKLPEGQIFYEIYAIDSAQNKTIRQGSFYHFLE